MIIKKTNILIVVFIGYIAQSCITYKADSKSVSAPDYNQRVEVKGTHFDGVLNPLGVSSIVVTTAGGAYAGYQSNLIQYNDGGKQTTSKVTNAILGAAVGFGTSYFLNRWCGWGKVKSTYEVNKDWIKSANKNFRLISGNHEDITIIPSSADNNFVFRNIQDAKDFSTVFPSSPNTDKAFNTGIINLTRTDLPTLIALYPNTKSNSLAQIKYIQTAPTYSDILNSTKKYPSTGINYEANFLNLISNCYDAIDFKSRFKNSTLLEQAYLNAFITENQSKTNFTQLNNSYKITSDVSEDLLAKNKTSIQRNYLTSKYILDEHDDADFLVNIYNQYQKLYFTEKRTDFIRAYLNRLDNTLDDGEEILWRLKKLSDNSAYPTLGATTNEVSSIISAKLNEEAKKNIQIIDRFELTNSNSQWDDWQKSNYTAGLVGEKGAMFILYGRIVNNSKYSIPCEITCRSGLEYEINPTGLLKKGLQVAEFFTGTKIRSITREVEGTQSSSFFIPAFPPNSKGAYALRLDFQNNYQRGGVNILDIGKLVITSRLKNTTIDVQYNENARYTSQSVIQSQEDNQNFVLNGIPERNLGDLLHGGNVDEAVWKEKWERIKEEMRRAEEARQRKIQNAKASGTCYDFIGTENVEVTSDYSTIGYKIRCKTDDKEYVIFKLEDKVLSEKIGFMEWYKFEGWYKVKNGLIESSERIAGVKDEFEKVANDLCGCH